MLCRAREYPMSTREYPLRQGFRVKRCAAVFCCVHFALRYVPSMPASRRLACLRADLCGCVRACVRTCVRTCVRACVCACLFGVHVKVCACVHKRV